MFTYPDLDKVGEPIISFADWKVFDLSLSKERVDRLWEAVSRYRTLFSDLTIGDASNFMRYVTEPNSIWLELRHNNQMTGVACFTNMHKITDTDAHIVFFEREAKDKVLLCQKLLSWVFEHFPLQRVSVDVPEFYFATKRLVSNVGFKQEGSRRNGILIKGRWSNVTLFGITRVEVEKHVVPDRQDSGDVPAGEPGLPESAPGVVE